jgi:putative glutamine amidotransferase
MTPRIGITTYQGGSTSVKGEAYAAAVRTAGGEPLWLQPADVPDPRRLEAVLEAIDGVLFSGGIDIHPRHFGEPILEGASVEIDEQRDTLELPLARQAVARGLAVLGICRGIQTLNVAFGGSVYQDLSVLGIEGRVHQQRDRLEPWQPAHPVVLIARSKLATTFDGKHAEVNSFHHQAVHNPAPGWVVTARAPDGVIEGLEYPDARFVVGVQWHPERMIQRDPSSRRLFAAFVEAARGNQHTHRAC